jgi:hypothetical protein
MSFADPKSLSPSELVIDDWLAHSQDLDELLLALSDILPSYFTKSRKPSLVGVKSLVLNRLTAHQMREV